LGGGEGRVNPPEPWVVVPVGAAVGDGVAKLSVAIALALGVSVSVADAVGEPVAARMVS
jgi:hypothetical protein